MVFIKSISIWHAVVRDLILIKELKKRKIIMSIRPVCAPKLWNHLPEHIKCSLSLSSFKSSLKTYLFDVILIHSSCYIMLLSCCNETKLLCTFLIFKPFIVMHLRALG